MNNPQKVIVYRSVAEQRQDEYLWGEGFLFSTGFGDIAFLLLVVAVVAIVYGRVTKRRF